MDLEQINLKDICQSKEQIINIINYHPTAAWVGRVMWAVLTNPFPMDMYQCEHYHQNGKDEHAPQSAHKMVHLAALPQPHAGIATTAATVKLKVSLLILSWSLFPYSTHGLVHDMKKETIYTDSTSLNWAKAYSQNNFNFFFFFLSRKCYLVTVKFSFAALYYWVLLTKTLFQLHWW